MKHVFFLFLTLILFAGLIFSSCEEAGAGGGGGSGGVDESDYTSPNIGTLKYIPAGQFQRDGNSSNISIISEPYRMSQHEITRQQFYDIMGTDPSDTDYSSDSSPTTGSTNITDPVQEVNWYHAIAFCNKLSLEEGLSTVYSVTVSGSEVDWANLAFGEIPTGSNEANWDAATCDWEADGYRLPTEMEWMWAAMGAENDYTKDFAGDDGTNSIDDYAWYEDNSSDKTHPVGGKTVNELFLKDMTGNVLEWCWDWCSNYPSGEKTDYRGTASGTERVNRGGYFGSWPSSCPIAYRLDYFPYFTHYAFGFRVVRQ